MHTFLLEKNENLTVWEISRREPKGNESADGYVELHECTKKLSELNKKQKNNVKFFLKI